jgi:hypothetical protein
MGNGRARTADLTLGRRRKTLRDLRNVASQGEVFTRRLRLLR